MKSRMFFLTLILSLIVGCASQPHTTSARHELKFKKPQTLEDRHDQIVAIQNLINEQINHMFYIQQHIATLPYAKSDTNKIESVRALYTSETQARDLDRVITVLSEAESRLADQNEQLYIQLGISRGSY